MGGGDNPAKKGLFNRINPLAIGLPPAIEVPPWRYLYSRGHHFSLCNDSQLNCHKRSETGKSGYSSALAILATLAGATPISL